MWMEGSIGIVATEALVNLWFRAAPLQGLRRWLVRLTPFLYSKEQDTHLFNCPYCLSFWVASALVLLYSLASCRGFVFLFAVVLSLHRLSNFLHLVFSLLRDKQLDLRVARNKT
jgi:hypothetical protein